MTGFEHYSKRKHLSISSLSSFARCPRRFFYSSGCRLTSPGGDHPALTFGSAIHKALPEVLTGEFGTRLPRALQAFRSVFTEEVESSQDEGSFKKRNLTRAKAMLSDFLLSHSGLNSLYSLVPPPKTNVVASGTSDYEVSFAVDIGLGVPLVGRIDSLVRHRDTGRLWALEWKTSSELSTRFLDSFQNSPQAICYALALRLFTNESIEGTIVEGLRVSHVNAENLCTLISVPEFKFESFITWAKFYGHLLLECERLGEFPQHFTGCNSYAMFGQPGYTCDYANLCSVPDWTSLKSLYVISEERPFVLSTAMGGETKNLGERALPALQESSRDRSGMLDNVKPGKTLFPLNVLR